MLPPRKSNEIRLLTVSAYYPHKNLRILDEVNQILNKSDSSITYTHYLTLNNDIFRKLNFKSSNIKNLGSINPQECYQAYEECDLVVLPTMLECFSAVYPESMKMNKPILTSDLSFARKLCQDAAIYFDPLCENDIAEKIIYVSSNKEIQNKTVKAGKYRQTKFTSSKERADRYIDILDKIS